MEDKNTKRLKKAYSRLCRVTQKKIAAMTDDTDIKILKDAFSAVKEGVNIGALLGGEDDESVIRVVFEGETEECSL